MNVFSFRTEYIHDKDQIFLKLRNVDKGILFEVKNTFMGECHVEINTKLTLEEVKSVINSIEDTHVALDTLKPVPLIDNDLKRTYSGN